MRIYSGAWAKVTDNDLCAPPPSASCSTVRLSLPLPLPLPLSLSLFLSLSLSLSLSHSLSLSICLSFFLFCASSLSLAPSLFLQNLHIGGGAIPGSAEVMSALHVVDEVSCNILRNTFYEAFAG